VTASAGDNFNLVAGTSIEGANIVTIRGGQLAGDPEDPDPLGSILTILGVIAASSVEMYGGSNLDYFDLINPDGINAPVTLNGLAGDDRFFIQAVPDAMIVNGGAGANRYYISSDAARALFVVDGVYADTGGNVAYPFSDSHLSAGDLTKITAALTINTGDGGNGGTRDAIYLSAAGSTTPLTTGIVTDAQVTGLGNTGAIHYTTTADGGTSLLVKLGALNDAIQVTGASANTQVYLFGGNGDDTVNAGTAGSDLSTIDGIVAFFGENGSNDRLHVYGVATAPTTGEINPNQLSAIAVTGLGSGTNQQIAVHNGSFGAGYTVKNINLTASSLEASQLTLASIQAFASLLENPTRNIDSHVASSLRAVTRDALFDYQAGDEVVYRVHAPGATPVVGLTDDTVYYVSGVDSASVFLMVSLDDVSSPVAVSRSLIGENSQVTLAHLDSDNGVTFNVAPTITDNKIVFADNHNLSTGQAVVYHIGTGNAPIGGLTDSYVYYVIAIDATTIQLAASLADAQNVTPVPVALTSPFDGTPDTLVSEGTVLFNAFSSVDDTNHQITFAARHNLVTGQAVVYHAGNIDSGGTVNSVDGLTAGRVYYVIRVNDTTIKLASSLDFANAGTFIDLLSPISSPTTNLDSLTTARSFSQSDIANNEIVFANNHGLVHGQAVSYQKGSGSASIGLNEGQIYYVIKVDDTTIQLASTDSGAAISLTVPAASPDKLDTASFVPSSMSIQDNKIIFASDPGLTDGQAVVYSKGNGNNSIGLNDGQVYYVKLTADPNAIQLALTVGGAHSDLVHSRSGYAEAYSRIRSFVPARSERPDHLCEQPQPPRRTESGLSPWQRQPARRWPYWWATLLCHQGQ